MYTAPELWKKEGNDDAINEDYIKLAGQEPEPRVPGEIKRSRDLRGGRWSWTLTFAQKRS